MTLRGAAFVCLIAAGEFVAGGARAGVWATEPVLGAVGDYSTNPALLIGVPHTAETRAAVLIDTPITYYADARKFSVQPSFRISNDSGYSSLTSNYAKVNFQGEFDRELDSFVVSGGLDRESSLYHDYAFNGSTGVRRDSALADAAWSRNWTPRLGFSADVSATRVRFGDASGAATLSDYTYASATPTLSWATGERTKLNLTGSFGDYKALSGASSSTSTNLELGLEEFLTALWSWSAKAGYSRAVDKSATFFGTFTSTQTGTVFTAKLSRQLGLMALSATASRQLVPTGLAYLSRQSTVQLSMDYPRSERWTFSGNIQWVKSQDPLLLGGSVDRTYVNGNFSGTWRWTEQWNVIFAASRAMEKFDVNRASVASTGLSLEFMRRFNRITFH